MSVYIFTGPSLPAEEARAELDAVYLPPVAQGDLYRVTLRRPRAIGIIDGNFEHVPAVWHKEILWALREGIHVFGAASMGALRAAELEAFGMEGVGAIFAAYRDGALEDDDEVALAHASAEHGYQPLSEAMVNIRRTLADAESAGVIEPDTRLTLEAIAKDLFYPDRAYPLILRRAADAGVSAAQLAALRHWLPRGRVDQKREDALAMLRLIRERLAEGLPPKQVSYAVQYTDKWDQVRLHAGELQLDAEQGHGTVLVNTLLDELRLDPDAYERTYRDTLLRFLSLEEAQRLNIPAGPAALQDTADAFRRERGLYEPEDVHRWLAEQELDRDGFRHLVEDETRLRWVERWARWEVIAQLPAHLRATGAYPHLRARAREKERVLAGLGLDAPSMDDSRLTADALWRWYFEERLDRPVPADVGRYARAVGFADEMAFQRAVLREFCYLRATAIDEADAGRQVGTVA